jgi:hypothetical protein
MTTGKEQENVVDHRWDRVNIGIKDKFVGMQN